MRGELRAITCESCGGAVAVEIGQPLPRCLFCGSAALSEQAALPEEIEPPERYAPFVVDEAGADAAFRRFARSSIWYPDDIRQARLELRRLMLPAWVWSGRVESHYAALVPAPTRSGARPAAGCEEIELEGVLVPASSALSRAELLAISPFPEEEMQPLALGADAGAGAPGVPYELGDLTRSAATQAAAAAMEGRHRALLSGRLRAKRLHTACLHHDLAGRPVLLPVYIGAYRRGQGVYRVVINGQTGKLTGKAPLSWVKIGAAVLLSLALLAVMLACMGAVGVVGSQL